MDQGQQEVTMMEATLEEIELLIECVIKDERDKQLVSILNSFKIKYLSDRRKSS